MILCIRISRYQVRKGSTGEDVLKDFTIAVRSVVIGDDVYGLILGCTEAQIFQVSRTRRGNYVVADGQCDRND